MKKRGKIISEDQVKLQKESSKYTIEKKLLENYLENPEKTLNSQSKLSQKFIKKTFLNDNPARKLFKITNSSNQHKKRIDFSTNPFLEKILNLKQKFIEHRNHNWESIIPLNNNFLNKKELGLENYYQSFIKNEPLTISLQTSNTCYSPQLARFKSSFTPKMTLIKSIQKVKNATKFMSSINEKTEKIKNNEAFPETNQLTQFKNNVDIEDTEESNKKKRIYKEKCSNLIKNMSIKKIKLNLSETFDCEKMKEFRNSLQTKSLNEEEKKFLGFIKKNDLLNTENMLRSNKKLTEIRDQVFFFKYFF